MLVDKIQNIQKSRQKLKKLAKVKKIPSSKKFMKIPQNSKVSVHKNWHDDKDRKLELLQNIVHLLLKKQNLFSFMSEDLEYQLTDLILQREHVLKFTRSRLKLSNHLTGARHLCVKHLLTHNMNKYEQRMNKQPFSYMPFTFTITKQNY